MSQSNLVYRAITTKVSGLGLETGESELDLELFETEMQGEVSTIPSKTIEKWVLFEHRQPGTLDLQ